MDAHVSAQHAQKQTSSPLLTVQLNADLCEIPRAKVWSLQEVVETMHALELVNRCKAEFEDHTGSYHAIMQFYETVQAVFIWTVESAIRLRKNQQLS